MSAWVAAADRLPKVNQSVIVTYQYKSFTGGLNKKQKTFTETTVAYWTGRDWNCSNSNNDGHGDHGLAYPVLFWRPFPRPPMKAYGR